MSSSFFEKLMEAIHAEGFPQAGGVDLDSAMKGSTAPFAEAIRRYDEWLARGFAGSMTYLARGRDRRADPTRVLPDAMSLVCVLAPYPVVSRGASGAPQYSPYLLQPDYHRVISEKLERVMSRFVSDDLKWKVCVDTSAVLEKFWASLAGLGSFGKNTLLLNRRWGSRFCLGMILLNQRLNPPLNSPSDLCGSCSRCLDACPTKALVEPGVLDASRCLCYLTLEHRGDIPSSVDAKQRGTWVAGCDECQRACPHNRAQAEGALSATHSSWVDWESLLNEDEESYRRRVKDSSLSHVRYDRFRKNVEIAYRNRGDSL